MDWVWILIAAFWAVNAVRSGIEAVKLTRQKPMDPVAVTSTSNEFQISLIWILVSLLMIGK